MTSSELKELVFAGRPVSGMDIIDAHAHIGPFKGFRILEYSAEGLLTVMDDLGIRIACISSIPGCCGNLYKEWNDEIIKAVRKWPDRFYGYMSVNAAYPAEAVDELKRCYDSGLKAIKIHTFAGTPYDSPNYECVWSFADQHSLPVLAHTWGSDGISQLTPCFYRYPNINWILAHGGSVNRDLYIYIALANKNVYVDTVLSSGPRGMLEYFEEHGLENRLVWGTDMAFMNAAHQLGKVVFSNINMEQKIKVLGANAIKALKLDALK